jgi:spore maturation protein CgeB
VYSRARIVMNLPLGDDLNFRFFEALSCGALLLTKRVANGQEELFREGVHFAAFGNEGELCEKIEHYLNAEKERKTIAEAGHQEVIKHHTLALRLETLLERVRSGPQFAAPVRRMGRVSMAKLQMYARHYVKGLVDRPPA